MLFQAGSLLLVIISVYILKRIHIFNKHSYKVVQGLVFNLTLPCAIVMSFATNRHPMNLLWLVVFGLFACMIPLFIVFLGSHGDEPRYRAYQMLNASGLNIGAFCLPVVQTFMGPSAGLPVIMLDIGNAIIATAASLTITRSLLHLGSPTKNLPLALKIRNVAHDFYSSLSFDIYMLMLVFMFAGLTVPKWIVTLITPFANANAFAAMAMIGLMMEVPDNRKDRSELGKVIMWRLFFGVIIAVAAWFLLPLDERVREIVVLAAFAPVTIFSTKFTDSLTGNAELAGFSLTVTAVIGLAIMTVLHAVLPVV